MTTNITIETDDAVLAAALFEMCRNAKDDVQIILGREFLLIQVRSGPGVPNDPMSIRCVAEFRELIRVKVPE